MCSRDVYFPDIFHIWNFLYMCGLSMHTMTQIWLLPLVRKANAVRVETMATMVNKDRVAYFILNGCKCSLFLYSHPLNPIGKRKKKRKKERKIGKETWKWSCNNVRVIYYMTRTLSFDVKTWFPKEIKKKNETDGTWEHMSSWLTNIGEEFNLSIIQPKKKKKEKKNLCLKSQKKKKKKRKITTKPWLDEGRPGFEGIQGNKEKKIRKEKKKKNQFFDCEVNEEFEERIQ